MTVHLACDWQMKKLKEAKVIYLKPIHTIIYEFNFLMVYDFVG